MNIMFDDILVQYNSFDNIIMDDNDMAVKEILCVMGAFVMQMKRIFSIGVRLNHYGLDAFLFILFQILFKFYINLFHI